MTTYTPEQTKALAIAAGYEDVELVSKVYGLPSDERDYVMWGNDVTNEFNPLSPDTCLRLMERYKLSMWPIEKEKYTAVYGNWMRERASVIADTIPEAVANCVLKILEAEE